MATRRSAASSRSSRGRRRPPGARRSPPRLPAAASARPRRTSPAGFGGSAVSGGIGGTYFRTDGYRAHNSEESGILGLSTSGALGSGKWSVDLDLDRTNREDPGALLGDQYAADDRQSDPLYRFDETDTDRGRLALTFRHPDGPVPYQATLYGLMRSAGILQTLPVAPGIGNRTFRDLHSGALGGIFEGEKSYRLFDRDGLVRLGAELGHETLDTNYRFVDDSGEKGPIVSREDGSRNRTAVFVTGGYRATDRLRLTGGVRWDRIADDFHVEGTTQTHEAWSPRAGLNYRVGDLAAAPVAFSFQFSRSFKAPTLDQLFDPHPFDDFQGGTISISNPHLVPQKAQNFEVGVSQDLKDELGRARLSHDRGQRDRLRSGDLLVPEHRREPPPRRRGDGADERSGFPLGRTSPTPGRASSRETGEHEGAQLKNVPEHLVRAGLSAALPAGFSAEAIWTWMGRRGWTTTTSFRWATRRSWTCGSRSRLAHFARAWTCRT